MPGGFLLDDDARQARLDSFDSWLEEQRKKAADAAAAAQQAVQTTATQTVTPVVTAASTAVQTAAQPVVQAIQEAPSAAAQAAGQRFDSWLADQQAQLAQTQAAQQAQIASTAAATPTSAPATSPTPSPTDTPAITPFKTPPGQAPGAAFDDWLDRQRANLFGSGVAQTVGDTANAAGTAAQSVLPHAEEPATQTDQVTSATPLGGPDLGKNWKTQFDFGAVYTGDYRTGTPHRGVDLVPSNGAGIGTEVDAFTPGQVTNIFRDPGGAGGLIVYVQDADGLTHAYMHLANTAPGLAVGQQIARGQPIAAMGESGTEGSPHLHYEVRKNASNGDPLNQLIDPRPYVSGDKQPGGTAAAVIPSGAGTNSSVPTNSQQTGNLPSNAIDASSQDAFARSFAPYAQYAAQKLGIDPTWVAAMSGSESNFGKADAAGHELFGVKALPGQPHTTLLTHEGENGGTQMNQDFAAYDSPLDSVNAWIDLIKNHYPGAVNAKDLPTFVHGLKSGGYFTAGEGEYLGIVSGIQQRLASSVQQGIQDAGTAVGNAASAVGTAVGGAASAVGTAAQQALTTATAASGAARSRAEDLANQGKAQLQQLQDQTTQLQQQLDDSRARLQKAQDDAQKQSDQFTSNIRQNFLQPRDFSGLQNQAAQIGQDVMSGVAKTAGSAFDQAQDVGNQALTGLGDLGQQAVSRAQGFTAPLTSGVVGAGREAEQQLQDNQPLTVQAARLGAGLTGKQLTPQAEDVITRITPPTISGLSLDPGGVVSAGLKGGGATATINDLLERLGTPRLTTPIGDTPLADIAGLGTNLAIPTGAEGRAAAGASRLPTAARGVVAALQRMTPEALQAFLRDTEGSVGPKLAAQLGARVGGTAAGVAGAEATLPPDAPLQDRIARGALGGAIGFAVPTAAEGIVASRGLPTQTVRDIVQGARPLGPLPTGPDLTGAEKVAQYGISNLLWGPLTHLWNVASQSAELASKPLIATLGGHGDEAMAGVKSALSATPEAWTALQRAWRSGATMIQPGQETQRALPGGVGGVLSYPLRALGAADDFFRVLGNAQGAGAEAQRLITEAGLQPTQSAQIESLLRANADRIATAGQQAANESVFASGANTGLGGALSRMKTTLLRSPDLRAQAAGLAIDAIVPFSRTPDVLFTQGVLRTPGISEVAGAFRVGKALRAGDTHGAQMAAGAMALGSVIGTQIVAGVLDHTITGSDDKEHPNSVNIGGNWLSYRRWGQYSLPLEATADFIDGYQKGSGKPGSDALDGLQKAADKTLQLLANESYASNFLRLIGSVGPSGSPTGEIARQATSYLSDRGVPASALLNTVEQLTDPYTRDPGKAADTFPLGILSRAASRTPGLAETLPPKLNLATGQPQQSAGLGIIAGTQPKTDPLTSEIARLNRLGYTGLSLPSQPPTSVTGKGGGTIDLPDGSPEQRAVAAKRGQILQQVLAPMVTDPSWSKMTDDDRALTIFRVMNRIEPIMQGDLFSVAMDVIGEPEAVARMRSNETVAGRRVNAPEPARTAQAAAVAQPSSGVTYTSPSTPSRAASAPQLAPGQLAQIQAALEAMLAQSGENLRQRQAQAAGPIRQDLLDQQAANANPRRV